MAEMPVKLGKVFVSYSHRDKRWLDSLRVHLKSLEREGVFDVWDDTRIELGRDWRAEIQKAIEEASVAVLLISKDFLASDFVNDVEVPALLQAAENRDITILQVILNPCRFNHTKLGELQAVNSTDRTLSDMTEAEQDRVFLHIAEQVHAALARPVVELSDKLQKKFREIERKNEPTYQSIRDDPALPEEDKEFLGGLMRGMEVSEKREFVLKEIAELDRESLTRILARRGSRAQAVSEAHHNLKRELLQKELQKLDRGADSAKADVNQMLESFKAGTRDHIRKLAKD